MSIEKNCFMWTRGRSEPNGELLPCGVTNSTHRRVGCCWRTDTCLSDGICRYDHSLEGGSGYYAAGCTDHQFGEGCRSLCQNNEAGDIVFTNDEWRCCNFSSPGARDCSNPTSEKFLAPPPADLASIILLPKSGFPTYVTDSPPTSTATSSSITASSTSTTVSSLSSATPSPTSSNSAALSSGAKAGIGVGAAGGCLALLSVLAFFIYRRRQRKQRHLMPIAPYPTAQPTSAPIFANYEHAPPAELPEYQRNEPSELPGTQAKAKRK